MSHLSDATTVYAQTLIVIMENIKPLNICTAGIMPHTVKYSMPPSEIALKFLSHANHILACR